MYKRQILVSVCADFGVAATASGPHPGVWVGERKIGAIGVGVRQWVTCHGVALNVATDLSFFDAIVPCRVAGMQATSLALELGKAPAIGSVRQALVRRFREVFFADAPAEPATKRLGKATR